MADIQRISMKPTCADELAGIIVLRFLGDQKSKHLSEPLKDGELPKEFPPKFRVSERYFSNSVFPKILKKKEGESMADHEARVKKFLHFIDSVTFSQIALVIDPDNEEEKKFTEVYHEISEIRMSKGTMENQQGCCKCEMF